MSSADGDPRAGEPAAPSEPATPQPPVFVKPGAAPNAGPAGAWAQPGYAAPGATAAPDDGRPVFVTRDGTVVGSGPEGPPAVDESRPWGLWIGPFAVFLAFMAVILLGALVAVVAQGDSSQVFDDNEEWLGLAQDLLWIVVAIVFPYSVYRYLQPGQLGLRRPPRPGRAAIVFILAIGSFYVLAGVYSTAMGLSEDSNQLLQDTGLGQGVVKDIAYALLFTVAAPVAEELLFRGLLFRTLRDGLSRRLGSHGGAIIGALISGVIFGAIHFGGGQDDFLPVLMALGVLLALSYHYSGTIFVPIAIHSINNSIATGFNADPSADWIYVLIGCGPLIALGFAFLLARFVKSVFPQDPPAALGGGQPGPGDHTGDGFPRPNYQEEFFPTQSGPPRQL